jgi:hypothetical protein
MVEKYENCVKQERHQRKQVEEPLHVRPGMKARQTIANQV